MSWNANRQRLRRRRLGDAIVLRVIGMRRTFLGRSLIGSVPGISGFGTFGFSSGITGEVPGVSGT